MQGCGGGGVKSMSHAEDEEQESKQRKFMGNKSCNGSKKKLEMDGKRWEEGGLKRRRRESYLYSG